MGSMKSGVELAIRSLKLMEGSVNPETSGKDAIRMARESLETALKLMGG